jgi:16S rRNA (guanine527-N7)-methyltransferase
MHDKDILKKWFDENEIFITWEQIDKLLRHVELVREASTRMNLISKKDIPKIIERHLLDSLHVLTVYPFYSGASVADLGSGAGFPGVPIAITRPDVTVALVESRRLKSLFLKRAIECLGISNATVFHNRWENLTRKFDIVLARAVYKQEYIRRMIMPKLSPSGVLLYFAKHKTIRIIEKNP